jgi:hypothetical protein
VDGEISVCNSSHIIILQVDDSLGVLHNSAASEML